jgi:hypothetical protein
MYRAYFMGYEDPKDVQGEPGTADRGEWSFSRNAMIAHFLPLVIVAIGPPKTTWTVNM